MLFGLIVINIIGCFLILVIVEGNLQGVPKTQNKNVRLATKTVLRNL